MLGRALEGLYALGREVHRGYWAWRGQRVLGVPVVGVGGLEVGGVGKTPVVAEIVRWLKSRGVRCGIVSRGYGRRSRGVVVVHDGRRLVADAREGGDEPVVLAMQTGVAVVVGAERYEAGRVLVEHFGVEVVVGDDLLQHWALARDLDIVVLDAARPLDGGRLLPVGRLREGPKALGRAQALVLSRVEHEAQMSRALEVLGRWAQGLVVAGARFLTCLSDPQGQRREGRGIRAVGFCGIGRPDAFRRALEALGVELAGWHVFRDHHYYTPGEMRRMWAEAEKAGAVLVTTAKDRVRVPGGQWEEHLWVGDVQVQWIGGWERLGAMIERLVIRRGR